MILNSVRAFKATPRSVTPSRKAMTIRAERDFAADVGGTAVADDQLKTERYIATNRFKVKPNAAAKFEQRWATRKSRLSELDGFRYFQLMRRVPRRAGEDIPEGEYNYVSFTIWEDKKTFQSWLKGDAFKEAHGGGSLLGFLDMLVNATVTLNGAPKPTFWHGLLPIGTPGDMAGKRVEDGWRVVDADGKRTLESEAFTAVNRFAITPGHEAAFEQRWAQRESKLKDVPGLKAFVMCRRDAKDIDDGYNYASTTVWDDFDSFEAWTQSEQFGQAHGGGGASSSSSNGASAQSNGASAQSNGASANASAHAGSNGASAPSQDKKKAAMKMMAGPPSPAFYECVLVLESPQGA